MLAHMPEWMAVILVDEAVGGDAEVNQHLALAGLLVGVVELLEGEEPLLDDHLILSTTANPAPSLLQTKHSRRTSSSSSTSAGL